VVVIKLSRYSLQKEVKIEKKSIKKVRWKIKPIEIPDRGCVNRKWKFLQLKGEKVEAIEELKSIKRKC
jgi:hypothetical protein